MPLYYFPREDIRWDLLQPIDHKRPSAALGEASYWQVKVGDRVADRAAWGYEPRRPGAPDVSDYVTFKWDQMDAWFEEDEEVFVHPRDPHHRVDVLRSSRQVRVEVGGVTVADTGRPRLLFETGLLTRYYIPKLDVRMDLLRPSDTVTHCPYKGEARHWSVDVDGNEIKDVAWTYHLPLPETARIADLVAFYNERVDAVLVDGEKLPVQHTPWSRPPRS